MRQPTVEVLSGGRGRPFAASLLETARFGYTEAEYALEGTATRYRLAPRAALARDGRWQAGYWDCELAQGAKKEYSIVK